MKVLNVIPSYFPAFKYGGSVFTTHTLNKTLVKKGLDISIYTTNAGLPNMYPVNRGIEIDGVKVTYFKLMNFFNLRFLSEWHFSPALAAALRSNLGNFDIICIDAIWNYPSLTASRYCAFYKKPYIIRPHGSLYPETFGKKAWKKWPYYQLIIKKYLNSASAVCYSTADEALNCHSFLKLKARAVIVGNGLDLSEFSRLPKKEDFIKIYPRLEGKKVILFLGRISWKKGLDILVSAYSKIARTMPDTRLLIVGYDEEGYGAWIRNLIKRCGLEESVTFAGALLGEDKLAAYAAADVFVLPSYSENFGLAVIEAMACGIPVVISNKVGISQEVRRHNAGVVVELSHDAVSDGIISILRDQEFAKGIAANAERLLKENYDISRIADSMLTVYKEIAEGN